MLDRFKSAKPLAVVSVGAVALLVVGGGTATAKALITGKDIKNGSLHLVDFSHHAQAKLKGAKGATGATGATGAFGATGATGATGSTGAPGAKGNPGTAGAPGAKGVDATDGTDWSVVDRNVMGNGYSYLRAGPDGGTGLGSLGIRTGGASDKSAFGNQTAFTGRLVSDLTRVGFSVFTTGEDITAGAGGANMPSIAFEVDPNLTSTSSNFSTLVFVPNNTSANAWTTIDATVPANGFWFLTGAAGTATGCDQGPTPCSFADVQAALADGGEAATIQTVSIGKGRDFAFSGAVDNLRVFDKVYDFEPSGVVGHIVP